MTDPTTPPSLQDLLTDVVAKNDALHAARDATAAADAALATAKAADDTAAAAEQAAHQALDDSIDVLEAALASMK